MAEGDTQVTMDVVGVLYHPHKEEARTLACEVRQWLEARGVKAWVSRGHDGKAEELQLREHIPGSSLVVVLGGDGSTLRAARVAAPYCVPIFGINLGRVGFLSEAEPDNWQARLSKVLDGQHWVERRLMLRAHVERDGVEVKRFLAVNDVVVGRGGQARVLRLNLFVDRDLVTSYTLDGLIVATPTGSTAYAMAAGGPLLPPELPNFLVVPVAPHLSLDRAVILHQEALVAIQVEAGHEAVLSADGQNFLTMDSQDRLLICKHEDDTCFARVGSPHYFYHRLMERLGYWHPQGLE